MASHLIELLMAALFALAIWLLDDIAVRALRKGRAASQPHPWAEVAPRFFVLLNNLFMILLNTFRFLWEERGHHEVPCLGRVFLLFVSRRNREHIIGDLEEEYRTSNKRFPRLWYWGQVIALVASYRWAALRRLAGLDAIRKMIRK